jgi:oligopeptide/dipeptide ABC transporter ATP-binding protein
VSGSTGAGMTAAAAIPAPPVLEIRGLRLAFQGEERRTVALDGIDLVIGAGEAVGVVGETGCGKTVTGLAAMRLLPSSARLSADVLRFDGHDMLTLDDRSLRQIRGAQVAMIFQNPTSAFNPVFTIGAQMSDVLAAHDRERGDEARDRIRSVLASVGMPDVERVIRAYPHQLSGGMLQRAMIATALLCRPRLIIADEPTTALDVTIAAQILALLRRLQREEGFSVMLITHDLGVVRSVCDRVAVLYAGRVVETATTEALFAAPQHPYTRGLLAAVPRTSADAGPLRMIRGSVPTDIGAITGCAFAPRCPIAVERCRTDAPALLAVDPQRAAACHFPGVEAQDPGSGPT